MEILFFSPTVKNFLELDAKPVKNVERSETKLTKKQTKLTTTTHRNLNAWFIPPIQCNEPEDGVFYAQIGPTGGKNGYSSITG